jgi:hypothetical protein
MCLGGVIRTRCTEIYMLVLKKLFERLFAVCGSAAAIFMSLALLHGLNDIWQPVLLQFIILKLLSFAIFILTTIFSALVIVEALFGTRWFGPLR